MDTNKDQPITPGRDDFNEVANQLPLLIWWSDAGGENYFFNSAWREYTGNAAADGQHDYWTGNVLPADLRQNPDEEVAQSGKPVQRMYRLKRYDGEYRWIAEQCVPRYAADETFAGYTGYCQDIQEMLANTQMKSELFNEEIEERESLNEELAASNEELNATNEELGQTQQSLADLNRELENIITVRTKALHESEQKAQALNEELVATNEELAAANEELNAANEELAATNEELNAANEELTVSQFEILKREKLFKSIAANIPKSLVVVIGKDHRLMAIEGDLVVKMGLKSTDYVGKHASEVAPFERYEANKPLYDKVLSGKQFAVDRKGSAGEDIHIEFVPLRNDENEVYAALIISLDITDIRKAEERSAKLAAIVTSSDDAIVSKTLDGIVTSWNAAAERMFGFTEKEMMGQSILKIIPED
ncbi:MAG: PAS domain S-box protein, partial [Mucilaginibacter sp.]